MADNWRDFPLAEPSVREDGWNDPGPKISPPVEVVLKPPVPGPAPAVCPPPRVCCADFDEAQRGKMLHAQCCEPFQADRPIPPTVFMMSDGGHGGMMAINFCPFCGVPVSFEEVPDAAS